MAYSSSCAKRVRFFSWVLLLGLQVYESTARSWVDVIDTSVYASAVVDPARALYRLEHDPFDFSYEEHENASPALLPTAAPTTKHHTVKSLFTTVPSAVPSNAPTAERVPTSSPTIPKPQCPDGEVRAVVRMYDSWGDGWGGTSLSITIRSSEVVNKTEQSSTRSFILSNLAKYTTEKPIFEGALADGSEGFYYVCLNPEICYDVTVDGGHWQDEVRWDIHPDLEGDIGSELTILAKGLAPVSCSFSAPDDFGKSVCSFSCASTSDFPSVSPTASQTRAPNSLSPTHVPSLFPSDAPSLLPNAPLTSGIPSITTFVNQGEVQGLPPTGQKTRSRSDAPSDVPSPAPQPIRISHSVPPSTIELYSTSSEMPSDGPSLVPSSVSTETLNSAVGGNTYPTSRPTGGDAVMILNFAPSQGPTAVATARPVNHYKRTYSGSRTHIDSSTESIPTESPTGGDVYMADENYSGGSKHVVLTPEQLASTTDPPTRQPTKEATKSPEAVPISTSGDVPATQALSESPSSAPVESSTKHVVLTPVQIASSSEEPSNEPTQEVTHKDTIVPTYQPTGIPAPGPTVAESGASSTHEPSIGGVKLTPEQLTSSSPVPSLAAAPTPSKPTFFSLVYRGNNSIAHSETPSSSPSRDVVTREERFQTTFGAE
jgi:hypothetical protein